MSDRVVVVTGASSGIGAALAELLGSQGASVALLARREDALREVATRAGAQALPIVADVTQRAEVRRAVETALAHFGHVDVWVNNAGRGITRPPSQLTEQDVEEMVRVNVLSVLIGTQEILPHFKSRGSGHVINISSMLGRIPFTIFRSAYNGCKHFVNALTTNFRDEVRATHPGIQVSLVSPGVVRTEFGRNAMHGGPDSRELPHSQSVDEVAAVIARVIETRAPDVYTRSGAHDRVVAYYDTVGVDP